MEGDAQFSSANAIEPEYTQKKVHQKVIPKSKVEPIQTAISALGPDLDSTVLFSLREALQKAKDMSGPAKGRVLKQQIEVQAAQELCCWPSSSRRLPRSWQIWNAFARKPE